MYFVSRSPEQWKTESNSALRCVLQSPQAVDVDAAGGRSYDEYGTRRRRTKHEVNTRCGAYTRKLENSAA
jgi:hypothetical protein